MKAFILIAISAALLSGCQRDDMSQRIPPGRTLIMTDESGQRFAVRHHAGDVYSIQPVGIPTAELLRTKSPLP